jgi:hypothetical protein
MYVVVVGGFSVIPTSSFRNFHLIKHVILDQCVEIFTYILSWCLALKNCWFLDHRLLSPFPCYSPERRKGRRTLLLRRRPAIPGVLLASARPSDGGRWEEPRVLASGL